MAGEWQHSRLGEFVSLQRGHDLTEPERKPGTVPVMGSAGQNGFHSTALAKGPGIVIGRSGASFGQVHYCPVDYWPHNTTLYVTDFHGNDPQFAYYFLKSINFASYNSGSAQPSLNRNFIYPIEVDIPPPDEQRAIAHILGTFDDKIELNRRMNETLEAIARALFKSWFVDFDPVRAKASGASPESICRRLGLTPDLLALFPDRLVDSELGEIPEGWGVSNVAEAAENIFSGGTPDTRKPEYWKGELSWCSSGETRNHFIVGTEKKITQAGVDNSSTKLAAPGDILIASAGQGITRGQTSYCAIQTFVNQSVIALRAKQNVMSPDWLFYNLLGRYEEMRSISDSHSSRGSLTTKLIGGMSLIYPGPELVNAFSSLVQPLICIQIANLRETETLSEIRDTLLPKFLSGEIRVDIEPK